MTPFVRVLWGVAIAVNGWFFVSALWGHQFGVAGWHVFVTAVAGSGMELVRRYAKVLEARLAGETINVCTRQLTLETMRAAVKAGEVEVRVRH